MHLSYGSSAWFPPLELLTSLAPVAEGMSLASSMLILPLFHPLHVAQQAAYLDIVSGGRLILGVAPGWTEDEFKVMDLNYKTRISRYVEGLTLIQRLFAEEEVDFQGKHFTAEGLKLSMKPIQRPRPAMWYGGSVAKAVARAADLADPTLGDSWVASSHLVGDVITKQAGVFHDRLDELGKPRPQEFPLLRNIVVAEDRETALRDAGPFLEASYRIFGNGVSSPDRSVRIKSNSISRSDCGPRHYRRLARRMRRTTFGPQSGNRFHAPGRTGSVAWYGSRHRPAHDKAARRRGGAERGLMMRERHANM